MIRLLNTLSLLLIPAFIFFTLAYGTLKKVNVYDAFVRGAQEGPSTVLKVFPYLLGIFVAIKGFQASGAFGCAQALFHKFFAFAGVPMEAVSMAILKPLSGSASTALFTDIIRTTGVDSQATKISAVIMGSAETTFYVLAVYLGAASIRRSRYLVPVCLVADAIGILIALGVVKLLGVPI